MTLLLQFILIFSVWAHDVPSEHEHPDTGTVHYKQIEVLGYDYGSSILDAVPTVTTLEGEGLARKRTTSLGETLKNEVRVNATSYGPTASRPVIRGLEGDRIRILQNGIGVLDASGASQDHAVPLDPISAESIEIVRGPITLLYGSSAIGGVVNITNSRIHDQFTEGFFGAADLQGASVNSGKSAAAKLDYGVANWMIHADGNYSKTLDMKVPEPQDKIFNSESELSSGAFGTSYIGTKSSLGVSVATFGSKYGVIAEPGVDVDMEQTRFDLEGEWRNLGFFNSVKLKSAQSIYKHQELEDAVPGTTFKNNGNETRLEFLHKDESGHSGILGAQFNTFEFSALGAEAFLPVTKNSAIAAFTFQEWAFSALKWNIGLRGESSESKPEAGGAFTLTDAKSFTTGSAATGILYKLTDTLSTTLNLSYNERAPTYQELFANGAHVATFQFQDGDENLGKEKSIAAELSLRHQSEDLTGTINVFTQRFTDFITLAPTGAFDDTDESGTAGDSGDDLPIFAYIAQDAEIYGAEIDTHTRLPISGGHWTLQVKGDYVRGKNRITGDNLPRMSPARASVGLLHHPGRLSWDVEVQNVFKQTDTAPNETETDGYVQTNLGASYKLIENPQQLSVYGRVNNVFDVEARNHVSFLKNISQLGGRNFVLGVRAYF